MRMHVNSVKNGCPVVAPQFQLCELCASLCLCVKYAARMKFTQRSQRGAEFAERTFKLVITCLITLIRYYSWSGLL